MVAYFHKACEPLKREQRYRGWQDGYRAEILFFYNLISISKTFIVNTK
jgi:hypothetical protein